MRPKNQSFIRSRIILIGIVAALVLIAAVWVFGPGAVRPLPPTPTLAPAPKITFAPPPDLSELAKQFPRLEKILNNPELDSVYKDFLVAYERGGVEAAEQLARERGLLTADNQIRVTLVLDTADSTALVQELHSFGVNVRGTYRDLIDIGIPLDLIVKTAQSEEPGKVFDQITQLQHVIGLQLPMPKQPDQNSAAPSLIDPVISEGVKVIHADAWQAAGYTGKDIKVGVLDQGFDGYRDLMGRELPISVAVQSFVPGIPADKTGLTHGTEVAEIIHAVAPDAQLYLAYYDGGDVSMGNAVDWLTSQGVHIISHSAGGMAAPMDGTGRDAELVDRAANQGVLWINSVGNSANQHYRGVYTDTNSDGIHEFAPDKPLLGFQSGTEGTTQLVLDWDDWTKDGAQDLDLYLLDVDGKVLASSRNSRDGGRPPVEQILFKFDDNRTYFVTLHGVNVTRPVRIDLYVHDTPYLEIADPIGSLVTPGDANGSLTIGAVYWRTNNLEPFSSHGPTADGRIKPDLVGPDGVSVAGRANVFYGTSAAAPHIAGAAALVWSAYPQASALEVRQYLISNTLDLLDPGPDTATGYGLLQLTSPPPTPTPLPPTMTPMPDQSTATPAPTNTPRKVVIPTMAVPQSRPPVKPAGDDGGSIIGIVVIGIAIGILGSIGFVTARRARREVGPWSRSAGPTSGSVPAACQYCGRSFQPDAVFCTQCGRPVVNAITLTKCSHCGRALRPGAQHCTRCGHPA
ncbi:MAG TPA: S8 family serine peptidase [Anaerolineae bacterium]